MENQFPPPFYRKPVGQKIVDIFTPRRSEVNTDMYISRPDIERDLYRAINGSMHILIYGESGGGKTWLYKKALSDIGAFVVEANMANASRFGSINKELSNVITEYCDGDITSYSESKEAEANVAVAKGKLVHTKNYNVKRKDPLEACFKIIRKNARSKIAILVLDNLERIFSNSKLMDELGDIITLLDDKRYAKYNIKLLIVGVPAGIKEYFSKTTHLLTVANRLEEISEVSRLNKFQVSALVINGFNNLMKANIPLEILDHWAKHTYNVTLGIPQKIHEYCLRLAYAFQDNTWIPTKDLIKTADSKWLEKGLAEAYTAVGSILPKDKNSRQLQLLFCLSQINDHTFSMESLKKLMHKYFPISIGNKNIQVKRYITKLIEHPNNIIRQDFDDTNFCFADPRYLMCLRLMLTKESNSENIVTLDVYRKTFGYDIEKQWGRKL